MNSIKERNLTFLFQKDDTLNAIFNFVPLDAYGSYSWCDLSFDTVGLNRFQYDCLCTGDFQMFTYFEEKERNRMGLLVQKSFFFTSKI